eukprot:TRINITY_DN255_c0_g1_i2.p1 TRINITY_DN255_c0_g1~~TRINITY_DN255_c0_g1_i2.p1  ORF type:complete len:224 (+),score=93.51 TRINITY_DN255_c0_g1_i2:57-674(+)
MTDVETIKLVVVGDGATGKTCLLMMYSQGEFPEDYVPTVFDNYSVELDLSINGVAKTIELGLWDTAGQEEYDRLRPLSYRNTDIFLVIFAIDSDVSYSNVRTKWIVELKHYSAEIPFILVATKSDLRGTEHEVITTAKGEALATEIGALSYVECSAMENVNVKEVFDKALELLLTANARAGAGGNGGGSSGGGGGGRRRGGCVLL